MVMAGRRRAAIDRSSESMVSTSRMHWSAGPYDVLALHLSSGRIGLVFVICRNQPAIVPRREEKNSHADMPTLKVGTRSPPTMLKGRSSMPRKRGGALNLHIAPRPASTNDQPTYMTKRPRFTNAQ